MREANRIDYSRGFENEMRITKETTLKEIAEIPSVKPFIDYVFFYDFFQNENWNERTLGWLFAKNPKYGFQDFCDLIGHFEKGVFFHELDSKRKVGYFDYSIPNSKGTVFIFAGGGYGACCNDVEGYPFARKANEAGYSAFVCFYGVQQYARMPGPINDAISIIKDVYQNNKNITKDYVVSGGSAAGHLVAMLAEKEHGVVSAGLPKPKGVFLLYPVMTLGENGHLGTSQWALGEKADDKDAIKQWSPIEHVGKDFPKTFLVSGTDDDEVPLQYNARALDRYLTVFDVPHRYRIVDIPHHAFGVADGTKDENYYKEALQYLFGEER